MSNIITIDYVPSPRQAEFHRSWADEVLYGGAAGGGKSKAIVMDATSRCLRYPGFVAYLFRRTFRELEDTLIAEARRSIPTSVAQYIASKFEYQFINGSVIRFRHLNNDDDVYSYQGAEMHMLGIDELTHFPQHVYDYLKTRVRMTTEFQRRNGVIPIVRCTSNPGGVGHAWVKAMFVDAAEPGTVFEREIWSDTLQKSQTRRLQYIPARATDNPHLTNDYIFELEQKPKKLRDALLHGNWDTFEGQVFMEFEDNPDGYETQLNSHVITPFPIPEHWQIWRSFDYGYAVPFSVGWWAVDEERVVYRIMEWYGCGDRPNTGLSMTVEDIARGIKERELKAFPDRRIRGVADPAIWDRSRGQPIADLMQAHGIYFEKGDHKRIPGKAQLHNRLRFDVNGRARLYVFKSCRAFIRTIPSLVYDLHKVEDVDSDGEDHVYDEVRYFLMANPLPAERPRVPLQIPKYNPLG